MCKKVSSQIILVNSTFFFFLLKTFKMEHSSSTFPSFIFKKRIYTYIWAASWENQRSGMSGSEDLDQISLGISAVRTKQTIILRLQITRDNARWLIKLSGCPGWSESSFGLHVTLLVLSWPDSYFQSTKCQFPRRLRSACESLQSDQWTVVSLVALLIRNNIQNVQYFFMRTTLTEQTGWQELMVPR